jgi:ketosteroid isomerase-like protein
MTHPYRMHAFTIARVVLLALIVCASALPVRAQNADEFLTAFINTVNANMPPHLDAAAVADLWTADGAQYHPNQGSQPTQVGREQLRQFFMGFDKSFADWTHVEKSRLTQGNRAVWEGTARGHAKETGKSVSAPIVFFLEFDDKGKVREDRVYVDVRAVMEQSKG